MANFKEVLCVKKNPEHFIFLILEYDHGKAKSEEFSEYNTSTIKTEIRCA